MRRGQRGQRLVLYFGRSFRGQTVTWCSTWKRVLFCCIRPCTSEYDFVYSQGRCCTAVPVHDGGGLVHSSGVRASLLCTLCAVPGCTHCVCVTRGQCSRGVTWRPSAAGARTGAFVHMEGYDGGGARGLLLCGAEVVVVWCGSKIVVTGLLESGMWRLVCSRFWN